MTQAPTHIVDEPGAKRTRCGLRDGDAYPQVWVKFVQDHVDGHAMEVCAICAVGGWPGKATT